MWLELPFEVLKLLLSSGIIDAFARAGFVMHALLMGMYGFSAVVPWSDAALAACTGLDIAMKHRLLIL